MGAVATLPSVTDERVGLPGHDLAERLASDQPVDGRADPHAVLAPIRHGDRHVATVPDDRTFALRDVLRVLRPLVGDAVMTAGADTTLERQAQRSDPPAVSPCEPLESPGARAMDTTARPVVSGFLDGIQRSRLVGHVSGSPIVFGTVAAVVRRRVDRRLETWQAPSVRRALFASRAQLGEAVWQQLTDTALPIVDITEAIPAESVSPHPMALRARALELVALERELVERRLAAAWCELESEWLWIDGGIAGNLAIDERAAAFGVVKSHNTLYGDVGAVRDVLALREGERSPAFLVGHRPRRAVASWYLRLRDAPNGDPLHGLVRVEVAPPNTITPATPAAAPAFTTHVDTLSSWILAERAPLSLPDPRWDTLTYGVHACEQYLKSIIGS